MRFVISLNRVKMRKTGKDSNVRKLADSIHKTMARAPKIDTAPTYEDGDHALIFAEGAQPTAITLSMTYSNIIQSSVHLPKPPLSSNIPTLSAIHIFLHTPPCNTPTLTTAMAFTRLHHFLRSVDRLHLRLRLRLFKRHDASRMSCSRSPASSTWRTRPARPVSISA